RVAAVCRACAVSCTRGTSSMARTSPHSRTQIPRPVSMCTPDWMYMVLPSSGTGLSVLGAVVGRGGATAEEHGQAEPDQRAHGGDDDTGGDEAVVLGAGREQA